MKDLNLKDRTEFLKNIGPDIAKEMSEALQKLTAERIKVEFSGVQAFDVSNLFVDIGEKCFGSHINFKSTKDNIEGIAVAIFPLSGTNALVELLLKRYLKKHNKLSADHELKLSTFKEAVNILLLTYITVIADALKVKLRIGVPKFDCFRNIEFIKPALLKGCSSSENLVSLGQFRITGAGKKILPIKGRFIIVF